jgi:hypothetical protein
MNIKKIIKEEVDNFDWASDVPSVSDLTQPKDGMSFRDKNDVNTLYTIEHVGLKMIKVSWDIQGNTYTQSFFLDTFFKHVNDGILYSDDGITESNDFDWVADVPDHILLPYIGLQFRMTDMGDMDYVFTIVDVSDDIVGVTYADRYHYDNYLAIDTDEYVEAVYSNDIIQI